MHLVDFPQSNASLDPMPGSDHLVPVRAYVEDASETVTTCWEMNDADLEALLKTRRLYVTLHSVNAQTRVPATSLRTTFPTERS